METNPINESSTISASNPERTRIAEAQWVTLFAFIAIDFGLTMLAFVAAERRYLDPIIAATRGVLTVPLVFSGIWLMIDFYIVIIRFGKLRPADVGLAWPQARGGLMMVITLWGVSQFFHMYNAWANGGHMMMNGVWSNFTTASLLGDLLANFTGVLAEEIAFRGFLLPQLYLKINKRWKMHPTWSLILALVTSQGLFALIHIPTRLRDGLSGALLWDSLYRVFLFGLCFAVLYLLTGNLFLGVAIHALANRPMSLFASHLDEHWLIVGVALLLIFAYVIYRLFNKPKINVAPA